MGRKSKDDIKGTLFDKLLTEFGTNKIKLADNYCMYQKKVRNNPESVKDIKKDIQRRLREYASHNRTPDMDTFLLLITLIRCSFEQLSSVVKLKDKTKALISGLALNVEYFSDSNLKLIRQGLNYKCSELSCNFQLDIRERWLKLTYRYKVLIFENDLTELKDIIWHDIEGNLEKNICLDSDKKLITGSSSKVFSIESNKPWWRKDEIEFVVDLYFNEVNIDNNKLLLAKTKSTESLKLSGSLLGLDNFAPVKICEHINDIDYITRAKLREVTLGEAVELTKEKDIALDENSNFQYEITPLEDSIFELHWR